MGWQPIETAPKGEFRTVKVGNKGGERVVSMPRLILAPTSDGNIVITYWNDRSGRWSMFSKDHPPTHWMPLPEPPR